LVAINISSDSDRTLPKKLYSISNIAYVNLTMMHGHL